MGIPVREHLLSRGPWANRANDFLTKAWERGWLPRPSLEVDALWADASKRFGERAKSAESEGRGSPEVIDFRLRLEKLTKAIREEAKLNSLGQAMAYGQLTRAIRQRLAMGVHFVEKQHPRGFEMAPPIIVIGHMRSGTTRIHKLLAADPAHSYTRYCDSYHPVPTLRGARRAKGAIDLAMLGKLNPWLQSIHPMSSGGVEEELGWLASALQHSIYESQWNVPSYSAWSEARDATPVYSEFVKILRCDAAYRNNAHLPRVMKVPVFSENLPELLFQFPDARLVIAQRESEHVLKSAISLCANQMAVQSDECDIARIEALWEHKITLRNERMASALRRWTGPVAKLHFDDLNTDWEAAIKACYDQLDLPLSDAALTAMRAQMAGSEAGAHRDHSEQLKRFTPQT